MSPARRTIACASIYAGDDKLFVPVENIEMLSRYGREDAPAQLDKLGGVGLAVAQGAGQGAHPRHGRAN